MQELVGPGVKYCQHNEHLFISPGWQVSQPTGQKLLYALARGIDARATKSSTYTIDNRSSSCFIIRNRYYIYFH